MSESKKAAEQKTADNPYADMGDDALAKNVRTHTKELNRMLREMKSRNIGITLVRSTAGDFVIERIWVERPL